MKGKQGDKLLLIGAIAKSYGVSENCIRRMETDGLLKPAYISESTGYRYYNSQNVIQIGTVLSLRAFGFTNEDIRLFLQKPDDLSVLHQKLQDKQKAIANLLYQFNRRLKTEEPCNCTLVSLPEACYFTKHYTMVPSLDAFSKIACDAQFEAIEKNLPVDFTLPPVIETASADYRTYDWQKEQPILFHIPLRKQSVGQNITALPEMQAVEVKWSYPGMDYSQIIPLINQFFESFSLKQTGTLRAAFDMGGHSAQNTDISSTVMHILIPVEGSAGDHEK